MPTKSDRVRVDYRPSTAAVEALQAAQKMFPKANIQALIDRMVITGLSALVHGKWQPPTLWGPRERWNLPDNLIVLLISIFTHFFLPLLVPIRVFVATILQHCFV